MTSKSLLVVLVAALLSLPAQAQEAAAALVAVVQGPARVLTLPANGGPLSQAARSDVHSLDSLAAGTLLQLGAGATATLAFHSDGHREDLTGPILVQITPAGSHVIKGDQGTVRRTDSEAAEALQPDTGLQRVQVSPGVDLDFQENAGVLTLSWESPADGPYIVSVYDPGPPRKNLWSSEASGTSVKYDGPVLTPSTPYVFQVETGGQPLGAARFQVTSDAAVQALGAAAAEVQKAPDDTAGHAMLAVAQDQQGDLTGAVQTLQTAIDQKPDDSGFIRRMQSMVTEMGDEARANVLQNRAKYLEDSVPPQAGYDDMDAYVDDIEGVYLP